MLKLEVSYRGLLVAGLALLALWGVMHLLSILILVITAFIFMAALLPYVEWMVRRGIPRVVAVLLLLLAFFVVVAAVIALVVPAMVDEFQDLRDTLPDNARDMDEFLDRFNIDLGLEERARDIEWDQLLSGQRAVDLGQRVLYSVLALFTIVVLTAYLLVAAPSLSQFLYRFVAPGHEPEVERVLLTLRRVVGGYVRAQAITSVAIGVYTFAVMFALDVPNAVAFGVLAAFADIIPVFGATIATAPPVATAAQESAGQAITLLVLLLIYQQFEDRYLTPKVYGSSLDLPPFVVLLTILVGGELLGIAGILLALPAAGVAKVALDYYLDRRTRFATPSGPSGEILAPDIDGGSN